MLLGLEAPLDELKQAFGAAADAPVVKGFAVGRTISSDACERWLAGNIGDEDAIEEMAARFAALTKAWNRCASARRLETMISVLSVQHPTLPTSVLPAISPTRGEENRWPSFIRQSPAWCLREQCVAQRCLLPLWEKVAEEARSDEGC